MGVHSSQESQKGSFWSTKSVEETLRFFDVKRSLGLPESQIKKQKATYGENVLTKSTSFGYLRSFFSQFKSPLALLLVFAALATFLLDHRVDTVVILLALGINVVVGMVQEGRASRAFEKLNNSQKQYATVIRDGVKKRISATDIVVGDIVVLEAGTLIPADVRLNRVRGLEIDEAILTGESHPVTKTADMLPRDGQVSDMKNMAWKGTVVTGGVGEGVVVAVGKYTEIGMIAEALSQKDEVVTPIQKNIARIARLLAITAVLAMVLIVALGLMRGEGVVEMLVFAIAIAVSAVPEGLPAAVTVVLAIGMEKLLSKGGLVRNLRAAETLGSTTVILTDKTGTLTKAEMTLSEIITKESIGGNEGPENSVLEYAIYASDAYVEKKEGELLVQGRPMEKAILEGGLKRGLSEGVKVHLKKRLDYEVFSSKTKYARALVEIEGKLYEVLSGAPEVLLGFSDSVLEKEDVTELTPTIRSLLEHEQELRGSEGERLLGVAYKEVNKNFLAEEVGGLVFAGLLSFSDPIREDVPSSINEAKQAGVFVSVVTGDNPETALRIAKDVGVAHEGSKVVHGRDFDSYNDEELYDFIFEGAVFARVVPAQKQRLAEVLRERGEVVAMTGDGVNDAPALRNADIGIAVGSGTDVAKEASDLVLLDNSFSVIVTAIREGRRIMDNLKRIVTHLISTSFGGIILITGALILALPLPILPAQVLWLNIVEEGFLNFAFAFEPAGKGIMKRNPNTAHSKNLITPSVRKLIIIISGVTGLLTFALYVVLNGMGIPIEELRTIMFVALSLDAIFFTLSLKDFYSPVWRIDLGSNKYLLLALGLSTGLLIFAFIFTPLRAILSLAPLTLFHISILIGMALINLSTIELAKFVIFRTKGRDNLQRSV